MNDLVRYYEENKSALNKQMFELGYTPHTIVQEAFKEGMDYREFIVTFLT